MTNNFNPSEATRDLFKQLIKIHNEICFKEKTEADFFEIIEKNMSLIDNSGFANLISERVQFTEDWIKNNPKYAKLCLQILNKFSEEELFNLGLRGSIRSSMFKDLLLEQIGDKK